MDLLLIEKVRNHEAVYNANLQEYRDPDIRQLVWEEIAEELNITANVAKERWDRLRRCFWNARNRRREEMRNGKNSKRQIWRYEQQMDFLTAITTKSNEYSRISKGRTRFNNSSAAVEETLKEKVRPESLEDNQVETNEENDDEYIYKYADPDADADVDLDADADTDTDINYIYKMQMIVKLEAHRERGGQRERQLAFAEERARNRLKRKRESQNKNFVGKDLDAIDMFYKSMAGTVKKLPLNEQTRLKQQIREIVFAAKDRHYERLSNQKMPQDNKQNININMTPTSEKK